jgi:hypothetical protein
MGRRTAVAAAALAAESVKESAVGIEATTVEKESVAGQRDLLGVVARILVATPIGGVRQRTRRSSAVEPERMTVIPIGSKVPRALYCGTVIRIDSTALYFALQQ